MIEYEKVLGAFSLLADLDENEARKFEIHVRLAINEVESILAHCDIDAVGWDKLTHAAAACAYYNFAVTESSSFSVGDVKINHAGLNMARTLKEDALKSIRPFMSSFAVAVI